MNKSIPSLAAAALAAFAVGSASAYATFSGVDGNTSESVLGVTPNSTAAEIAFKSNLIGVGTENFENQPLGSVTSPLVLNFGAAGNATLQSGSGTVRTAAAGATALGRYSVPGGSRWFDTVAGGSNAFKIDFDQDVAAFGFYGVDIGDFNGTVALELLNANSDVVRSFDVPVANLGMTSASVVYFGAIAQSNSELFRSVRFVTRGSSAAALQDFFGFDSFTVGAQSQLAGAVPEPTSLALIGAALLGLGLIRRRRA